MPRAVKAREETILSDSGIISSLFLMTLIAALVIGVVAFVYFIRKRANRHPMDTPRGQAAEQERREMAKEQREAEERPEL